MENTGPGYGTDINVPVYATVKGVGIVVCLFGLFASIDLMIGETTNLPVCTILKGVGIDFFYPFLQEDEIKSQKTCVSVIIK